MATQFGHVQQFGFHSRVGPGFFGGRSQFVRGVRVVGLDTLSSPYYGGMEFVEQAHFVQSGTGVRLPFSGHAAMSSTSPQDVHHEIERVVTGAGGEARYLAEKQVEGERMSDLELDGW